MEILGVALQPRNHRYYNRGKSQISDRFGSSPSRAFRKINCRTFQSQAGILPPPFTCDSPPVTKIFSSLYHSSPPVHSPHKNDKHTPPSRRSSAIPINSKPSNKSSACRDDVCCPELWAGPTYSNSPPPSSLPIPKFSLRQKRSVSLDLPVAKSEFKIHAVAKSAPASPTRESYSPACELFLNTASATENLRRILHLDITDD